MENFEKKWINEKIKKVKELVSSGLISQDQAQMIFPEFIYDDQMDKECIELCNSLNTLPGLRTFESCCGHLKDQYSVWFFCDNIDTISRLGRCVERNYSDGKWEIVVDSSDTNPKGVFWLRSKEPFDNYFNMNRSLESLIESISYWFRGEFDSYFSGAMVKENKAEIERLQDETMDANKNFPSDYEQRNIDNFMSEEFINMEEGNDEVKLVLPTEEQFVSRIKNLKESTVICHNCEKVVKTIFYPYGYNKAENDIWYIGLCPDCESVIYSKD